MKIVVLGTGLAGDSRLRLAAAGLALRGHQVLWDEDEPAGLGSVRTVIEPAARGIPRQAVDVVLGSASPVLRVAWKGWLAGAHVMALEVTENAIRRWSWIDRWAFGSLRSVGLVEGGNQPAPGETFHGIDGERITTWSDAAPPPEPDAAHPDVEILERRLERELARRDGHAERAAVFLDRDGTLVIERHYLSEADEIEILPGVPRALGRLHAAGYRLIVISNQAGVGRGLFGLSRVHEAMARLRRDLRNEGIELDAVYFCPHAPDAGCECRKPGTRLLRDAAANQMLSLRRSFVVGDRLLDVATARNAGAVGILVRTGYGESEIAAADDGSPGPAFIATDLAAAADWIATRGHAAD